jgi:uncharacterized protein
VTDLVLRPLEPAHLPAVAALNAAEVPRLGPLDDEALAAHAGRCDLALVAVSPAGDLVGFVLALGPGHDYASANYRWFERRGGRHLYVDRVAVATSARRRGVASALYDAVEDRARADGLAEVTCEVNVRPPNPGSLAFHVARGFVEVGQQDTSGGAIRVALLAKPLGAVDR